MTSSETEAVDHEVVLSRRQVVVSNYNASPEKEGDSKRPRGYLSVEVLLEPDEIDAWVRCADGASVIDLWWDGDGNVRFRDIAVYDLKGMIVDGTASIGRVGNQKMHKFVTSTVAKIKLEPEDDRRVTMKCQVGVEPTGHCEDLEWYPVEGRARFSFNGAIRVPQRGGEDDGGEDDDGDQEKLGL